MKNAAWIAVSLGLLFPAVACAQSLPMPELTIDGQEKKTTGDKIARRAAKTPREVTFTYWPKGVKPIRPVTLTVDLVTGQAKVTTVAHIFRRLPAVQLSKRKLAAVRRAVRGVLRRKGRIDLPSLTLEASVPRRSRAVQRNWTAKVEFAGGAQVTIRQINNPATRRFAKLMIDLAGSIQRARRPRPLPLPLPRPLPKLPLPLPRLPLNPLPLPYPLPGGILDRLGDLARLGLEAHPAYQTGRVVADLIHDVIGPKVVEGAKEFVEGRRGRKKPVEKHGGMLDRLEGPR